MKGRFMDSSVVITSAGVVVFFASNMNFMMGDGGFQKPDAVHDDRIRV
jgi:hypothetical protein